VKFPEENPGRYRLTDRTLSERKTAEYRFPDRKFPGKKPSAERISGRKNRYQEKTDIKRETV
jgi:hypothetical protein